MGNPPIRSIAFWTRGGGDEVSILGGLGRLRSGGEKLGSGQGHIGSLPYWWLQSTGKVGWERREALLGGGVLSRFMGSRSHPHRVLSVCVCVCVSRCLWVCVIEADSLQLRVITVGLYLFLSRSLFVRSLQCCGRRLRSVLVPRFLSPAASWTPIAGPCPLLPCATPAPTESSVSAYGKLRLPTESSALPTESSASAYGSSASALRKAPFCLRKAPPLPYGKLRFCLRKAPPLPYGKLRFCLRKAPPLSTKSSTFSSRCVLLLVINSLFRNWILPSSLWHLYLPPPKNCNYKLSHDSGNSLKSQTVWFWKKHTTHTCCFLWFTGTFHRRNGFYTVQAVCAIALHLPYT